MKLTKTNKPFMPFHKGYVSWTTRAIQDQDRPLWHRAVLSRIAHDADEAGFSTICRDVIAYDCGTTRAYIDRIVREMMKEGLLVIDKRSFKGAKTVTRYRLTY
jgi:hypothetical protein